MALTPPPRPLTKEEWERAGCRDRAFDEWYRYSSHHLGFFLWLKDKIQKKECPNAFRTRKIK